MRAPGEVSPGVVVYRPSAVQGDIDTDTPALGAKTVRRGLKVPPDGMWAGVGYFHQVSKMVTGTVRLCRVRRYFCSMSSAAATGTSRPSR